MFLLYAILVSMRDFFQKQLKSYRSQTFTKFIMRSHEDQLCDNWTLGTKKVHYTLKFVCLLVEKANKIYSFKEQMFLIVFIAFIDNHQL